MARIMISDDSSFMRMILKKIFVEHGHEVVAEAGDGMEAVQLYRQHKPDICTMDITMPKVDGIEAVRLIHEEDPLARIVMVSAIGQKTIMEEAIKAGATDFLVKPFDPAKVMEVINRIAGNKNPKTTN